MVWTAADIAFEIVDDLSDDPVVTIRLSTLAGPLTFMAEPVVQGTALLLNGVHVQDSTPNRIGAANLLVIAQALMERMELDGLVVEGAIRTTGAHPGHRLRRLRFTRHIHPAAATGLRNPQDN